MTQVIYKIINLVNDKFYIGSTTNKKVRFRQHRKLLRGSRHHCKHLQAAWNKYGEAKFDFVIAEEVDDDVNLQLVEDKWLKEHYGKPYCYNSGAAAIAPWRGVYGADHPNFGRSITEDQKLQISRSLKTFYAEDYSNHPRVGKTHTEETKERIRQAKLANPTRAWLGKERSQETKDKIGATQKGAQKATRTVSEAGKAKIRTAAEAGHYNHWEGRTHTAESKAKMSKPVVATSASGQEIHADSITHLRISTGLKAPTINRALKAGQPIAKGKFAGWSFKYLAPTSNS